MATPFSNGIRLSGGVLILAGVGAPEGVVSAPPGSEYYRTDGSKYSKATGSGATGWVLVVAAVSMGTVLLAPVGLYAANTTSVTALATNASVYVYMGQCEGSPTTCEVHAQVTTAAATVTWAEVAVFGGLPALGASTPLTRLGVTSVATTFATAGAKETMVALSGAVPGTHLWVAFGSQATTPFQLRALLPDAVSAGVALYSTNTRPSTLAAGGTPGLAPTVAPPWCYLKV